jgi:hypothetical protein
LVIVICNPLTTETKTLPAPNVMSLVQPEMVRLVTETAMK